jgi:hypothetical protein
MKWGAKEEKSTIVGQWPSPCTCFFDMPLFSFHFSLSSFSRSSHISIRKKNSSIYSRTMSPLTQNYVCAFFRKGGMRGVFSFPIVLIIILYYYCVVSLSKRIRSLMLSSWGEKFRLSKNVMMWRVFLFVLRGEKI